MSDLTRFKILADTRKTESPQLWSAGCSITHGVGVDESERFSTLLANKLGLPLSSLTQPGSGITWAADQILRSDLRKGDTLVWGLTAERRVVKWGDDFIVHLRHEHIPDNKWMLSNDVLYKNCIAIAQVENFCRAVGVHLYVICMLDQDAHYEQVHTMKHFIANPYRKRIDLGTDGSHPGPRHHIAVAELIHNAILNSHGVI